MRGFQPNRGDSAVKNKGEGPRGFDPTGADGAARAQALNQAPDSVPAMMKPGEFVLPPDTVHAMGGADALQGVVDATHTPVRGFQPGMRERIAALGPQIRGFAPGAREPVEPPMFFANGGAVSATRPRGFAPALQRFANGGLVQDEQKRTNSFGDAAAAAANPGVTPVGATSTPSASSPSNTFPGNRLQGDSGSSGAPVGMASALKPAQPPAPATTANVSPTGLYMQDRAQELKDQWGQGQYAQAVGTAARTAVQGLGMYGVEAADKLTSPWVDAAKGFGAGLVGSGAPAPAAAAPEAAPAPSAQTSVATPTDQRLANGTQSAPGSSTASEPYTPRGLSTNVTKTVGPDGRVTYSGENVAGDITINGGAPRNGGQISAQNMAAADKLAPRGFDPTYVRSAPQNPTRGFVPAGPGAGPVQPGGFTGGFSGVIGQQSGNGNMWNRTPEQQRRDAEVQASSIHKPTAAIGLAALRAQDATDLATIQAQGGVQQETIRQVGGLQREGIQQAGETARTGMRVGVDQQRANTDARLADSKITARGFDIEAAKQRAQLSAVLTDPKASVQEKMQAQKNLLAMQGKDPHDRWRVQVTPAMKNADGSTTAGSVVRYNEGTGEVQNVDLGQGGTQPRVTTQAQFDAIPKGATYIGEDGRTYRKPA